MTHQDPPEKTQLDVGFVPLTDCAPLAAALEKGFFEQEGLAVTLRRQRSWAGIRDNLAVGVYDAAQLLYPMPLAMSLGVGGPVTPTVTALCLGLSGNAITLSHDLADQMARAADQEKMVDDPDALAPPRDAGPLRSVIRQRREAGQPPLTFGIVFPTSTHHYEMRYWLESAGIDPDADLRLIVLPPPDMPAALRDGQIQGFCVGEPWNSFAVQRGWGRVMITKHQLWNNGPEKVLGVTRDWADRHPATHRALLRAIVGAARWCDDPGNRVELASLIAGPRYVDLPEDVVAQSLTGRLTYSQTQSPQPAPDFHVFHRYAANFPWTSHARWFLEQMVRAGQLEPPTDPAAVAEAVSLTDVYRQVAADLDLPAPTDDEKSEGHHEQQWTLTRATAPIAMGPDRLFDGRIFEPRPPAGHGPEG